MLIWLQAQKVNLCVEHILQLLRGESFPLHCFWRFMIQQHDEEVSVIFLRQFQLLIFEAQDYLSSKNKNETRIVAGLFFLCASEEPWALWGNLIQSSIWLNILFWRGSSGERWAWQQQQMRTVWSKHNSKQTISDNISVVQLMYHIHIIVCN